MWNVCKAGQIEGHCCRSTYTQWKFSMKCKIMKNLFVKICHLSTFAALSLLSLKKDEISGVVNEWDELEIIEN